MSPSPRGRFGVHAAEVADWCSSRDTSPTASTVKGMGPCWSSREDYPMGKSLNPPRDIVQNRSENRCEMCGVELTRNVHGMPESMTARSVHHRQPKREGGKDSVINLVNLCWRHHKEIHADEENAAKDGWIVLGRHPGKVPFLGWRGLVLPDEHGGLALVDFGAGRVIDLAPVPRPEPRRKRVANRARPGCRKSRKTSRAA